MNEPGPNSDFWSQVRDLEDLMVLSQVIDEWAEALLILLRQEAGPAWTQYALEKAIIVRRNARKMRERLKAIHPRPWEE